MLQLLVGTTKGAFILEPSDDAEASWSVRGPFCDGWPINHVVGDPATGALWAGGGGAWSGAGVWRSTDGDETWSVAKLSTGELDTWAAGDPGFAEAMGWEPVEVPFGAEFSQVWSLGRAGDRLYAGTKPAALLASDDGGVTWEEVESLRQHPSAEEWSPGAAGLVLHTILADRDDPSRLWLGISAAGVFASKDGGEVWERRNVLAAPERADAATAAHPAGPGEDEVGHCVHHLVQAHGPGDVLYQRNHVGVWRSSDGGMTWSDITPGLPSTFGFPMRVHPRDPAASAGRGRGAGPASWVVVMGRACDRGRPRRLRPEDAPEVRKCGSLRPMAMRLVHDARRVATCATTRSHATGPCSPWTGP